MRRFYTTTLMLIGLTVPSFGVSHSDRNMDKGLLLPSAGIASSTLLSDSLPWPTPPMPKSPKAAPTTPAQTLLSDSLPWPTPPIKKSTKAVPATPAQTLLSDSLPWPTPPLPKSPKAI